MSLSDEGPTLETLKFTFHQPFYISICIRTLPTQHTTFISVNNIYAFCIIILYYIKWSGLLIFSATNTIDNLTCAIIHDLISIVSIIMKRIRGYCSIFVGQ